MLAPSRIPTYCLEGIGPWGRDLARGWHMSALTLVRLGLARRRGSSLLMQVPPGPLALSSQPVLGYPWVFTLPCTSENEPLSPGKICIECGIALNS